MTTERPGVDPGPVLHAGLPPAEVEAWRRAVPAVAGDLDGDAAGLARFAALEAALRQRLPPRPRRSPHEAQAAAALLAPAREARRRFLRAHASGVYRRLTGDLARFVRVRELLDEAAERFPGLVPDRAALAAESARSLRDKEGIELDHGLFLGAILGDPGAGLHLCHAMLLPREASVARLPEYRRQGRLDLGAAAVARRGRAVHVELRHPRHLNAEDDTTLPDLETAIDVALLDDAADVAVLRGGPVDHPRYGGRRVFCSGINLTHLAEGRIPFAWYLDRELGCVDKIYRGLARPDRGPEEPGGSVEKPWIAAVEAFAIGGGCQYLLVVDVTLAEADSYFTLPARKEGIVPGAANLRLPRFAGDRLARQAIQLERRIDADSAAGRLLADEIVPRGEMDAALDRAVAALTSSGVVSAAANRRALRLGQEPLDLLRRYLAVYALDQAVCHLSPALVDNLARHWGPASGR